nr:MAG: hypothetical protein BECKLPF1236C_GA0070990_101135 [Candidatus Kentron sp. LPFa]
MITVNISDLGSNLLAYSKRAQQGNRIEAASKNVSLATVGSPTNPGNRDTTHPDNVARARLRELAETAVIRDVVSPTGESWGAME